MYEYKWSLLFFNRMRQCVNDVFFSERARWTLCFLFLYSIVTENLIPQGIQEGIQEVRLLRPSSETAEAAGSHRC